MRHFQLCMVGCVAALLSVVLAADAGGDAWVGSSAVPGNPLWAVTLDRLPATRDRPLFSPSRRPPPPPPPQSRRVETMAAIAAPGPPPSVVLLGIVTDANGAWALVRAGGTDKIVHARLGDEIAGWKVSEIEPRRLVLASDDRSASFALFAHMGAKNSADSAPVAKASVPVARTANARAQSFAQEGIDRRSGR
jgi:hypothetical protein